jgi:hypothetical protein
MEVPAEYDVILSVKIQPIIGGDALDTEVKLDLSAEHQEEMLIALKPYLKIREPVEGPKEITAVAEEDIRPHALGVKAHGPHSIETLQYYADMRMWADQHGAKTPYYYRRLREGKTYHHSNSLRRLFAEKFGPPPKGTKK